MSRLRCLALALAILVPAAVRSADSSALAGKWVVQAETPQGPMELGFDMKLEGGRLVGTVATFGTVVPMNDLKFEDPQLSMQITVMDSDYKLNGMLKEGMVATRAVNSLAIQFAKIGVQLQIRATDMFLVGGSSTVRSPFLEMGDNQVSLEQAGQLPVLAGTTDAPVIAEPKIGYPRGYPACSQIADNPHDVHLAFCSHDLGI